VNTVSKTHMSMSPISILLHILSNNFSLSIISKFLIGGASDHDAVPQAALAPPTTQCRGRRKVKHVEAALAEDKASPASSRSSRGLLAQKWEGTMSGRTEIAERVGEIETRHLTSGCVRPCIVVAVLPHNG
jgi:hypothetical protein